MALPHLILHAGALGDLVLTVQLARHLAGAGVALEALARVPLGALPGAAAVVHDIEGRGTQWLYVEDERPAPETLRAAVAGRPVLNALGAAGGVVHRRLLRAGARSVLSVDPPARAGDERHITTQWLEQLRPQLAGPGVAEEWAGARGVLERLGGGVVRDEEGLIGASGGGRALLAQRGGPVLVHPGSGGRAKCWPAGCFRRVAEGLRAAGREVRFVLGPVELERWTGEEIAALTAGFEVVTTRVGELAAVVGGAAAVVGNDAGPGHLAALGGVRTLVVFGPTRASVWRPVGAGVRVWQGDVTREDWGVDVGEVVRACGGCSPRAG